MKVYISGPVTGLPELNRPAFDDAAMLIRAAGHKPIIPHDHVEPSTPWLAAMRICIKIMMDTDIIYRLPKWTESRGSKVEMMLAALLCMPAVDTIPELMEYCEDIR